MGRYVMKVMLGKITIDAAVSQALNRHATALQEIHFPASDACANLIGKGYAALACILRNLISRAVERKRAAGYVPAPGATTVTVGVGR